MWSHWGQVWPTKQEPKKTWFPPVLRSRHPQQHLVNSCMVPQYTGYQTYKGTSDSVCRADFGPFSAYLLSILVAKALSFILSMKLVSLAMLFLNEQEGWARWLTPLIPSGRRTGVQGQCGSGNKTLSPKKTLRHRFSWSFFF